MAVRRVALEEATTVMAPLVSLRTLHCTRVQYGLVYHIGSKLPTKVALLEAKREYFQGPLALCRFVFVARVFVGVVAATTAVILFFADVASCTTSCQYVLLAVRPLLINLDAITKRASLHLLLILQYIGILMRNHLALCCLILALNF